MSETRFVFTCYGCCNEFKNVLINRHIPFSESDSVSYIGGDNIRLYIITLK